MNGAILKQENYKNRIELSDKNTDEYRIEKCKDIPLALSDHVTSLADMAMNVIISDNIVTGNFATHGGLFMIIRKGRDYFNNDCTPVIISGNKFTKNTGCNKAMGMITVQCFFGPSIFLDIPADGSVQFNENTIDVNAVLTYGEQPL